MYRKVPNHGEVEVHPHHQLWLCWKVLTNLNEEEVGVVVT